MSTTDPRDALIAEITEFLAAQPKPMAESTFGRLAVNDGKFVKRLRQGKNVTLDRMARVRRYIADHQATPERSAA